MREAISLVIPEREDVENIPKGPRNMLRNRKVVLYVGRIIKRYI